MGSWTVCNATLENATINEAPLWDGGITFHRLSELVGAVFAVVACAVSFFLIMGHATHYSKPEEQRHIIRILFMVPIYSLVAWLSIYFYHYAVYFEVIGDCYEAFCISAFFALMCHYIAPDLHSQKDYFRGVQPKPWLLPVSWFSACCGGQRGIWRNARNGLTWFNIIWVGVFQYCFMRVLMTIVAVASEAGDRYCQDSLSPAFAHVWVVTFEAISVSIAMYCLIQFYHQVSKDIKEHRPFLKILSIKLVIFLSFWQLIFIDLLVSAGAIKGTKRIQLPDLKYALPELLINIEMAFFGVLHLWAFSFRQYATNPAGEVSDYYGNGKVSYEGGKFGVKALIDAMNPFDLIAAIGRGFRWLFVGRKNRKLDPSYRRPHETIDEPTELSTAYEGAGTDMPGGRTGRYGSAPDEEGEILLSHAQPNPEGDHLGASSYPYELDAGLHDLSGRYYGQGASPYDESEPHNPEYPGTATNPYPDDGPLREQAPMPIPDPYRPPAPYPENENRQS
ncbi:hypothetical protein N7474_002003 [Penicillium riverlandense]|uniref:uncharacterized protein n=1 Tax=Penicillium riverlandense TaxID=1903569 RepID=UPI0025484ED3|nr:uncharacterized protein N7474_002003 [Penicillium riverlandense]KAJ5833692.1 hypothetical protein N7474_002003 [Penicillium riverlandense]